MTCLYIVVPCYNEQEVLPETSKRLAQKMKSMRDAGLISASSRVVFVDDGSRDETWKMIEQLTHENTLFGGIKLSRNRGHQNALLCGLMFWKTKNIPLTLLAEVFGTAILGGLCAYPVAILFMGMQAGQIAFYAYVIPFLISTAGGAILSGILLGALRKTGILKTAAVR